VHLNVDRVAETPRGRLLRHLGRKIQRRKRRTLLATSLKEKDGRRKKEDEKYTVPQVLQVLVLQAPASAPFAPSAPSVPFVFRLSFSVFHRYKI